MIENVKYWQKSFWISAITPFLLYGFPDTRDNPGLEYRFFRGFLLGFVLHYNERDFSLRWM
jgi:hypothetical protein